MNDEQLEELKVILNALIEADGMVTLTQNETASFILNFIDFLLEG